MTFRPFPLYPHQPTTKTPAHQPLNTSYPKRATHCKKNFKKLNKVYLEENSLPFPFKGPILPHRAPLHECPVLDTLYFLHSLGQQNPAFVTQPGLTVKAAVAPGHQGPSRSQSPFRSCIPRLVRRAWPEQGLMDGLEDGGNQREEARPALVVAASEATLTCLWLWAWASYRDAIFAHTCRQLPPPHHSLSLHSLAKDHVGPVFFLPQKPRLG